MYRQTKDCPTSTLRRSILGAGLFAISGIQAKAQGVRAAGISQLTEAQRQMLTSLPVTPWLSLRESTISSVQQKLQQIIDARPGIVPQWGDSQITGGALVTVSSVAGAGLLGEKGLRIFSLNFDLSQKLELVIFMFERGFGGANIGITLDRVARRFSKYASPIKIMDNTSEAADKYYIFDIGRFVIEVAIPQFGTFVTVNFSSKDTHKKMRIADSSYDLFMPVLERGISLR